MSATRRIWGPDGEALAPRTGAGLVGAWSERLVDGQPAYMISCPDEWVDVVHCALLAIEKTDPDFRITQIKEKFGGLRLYLDHPSLVARLIVEWAEMRVAEIEREADERAGIPTDRWGTRRRLARQPEPQSSGGAGVAPHAELDDLDAQQPDKPRDHAGRASREMGAAVAASTLRDDAEGASADAAALSEDHGGSVADEGEGRQTAGSVPGKRRGER